MARLSPPTPASDNGWLEADEADAGRELVWSRAGGTARPRGRRLLATRADHGGGGLIHARQPGPQGECGMTEPPEREQDDPPTWEKLQESIHWWLVTVFGLNSPRDKDIWLLCIGAAMDLERLAVGALWIADGRPGTFPDYEPRMTLGQAHQELAKRGLFDVTTRAILKAVADLRNSVAHRHAVFVTIPSLIEGHQVGEYKGRQIFQDPSALAELIQDKNVASKVLYDWMAAEAPDLAEDARRSGAHPPP